MRLPFNVVTLALLFLSVALYSLPSFAQGVYVNPYVRGNGTQVEPHYRSSPNDSLLDNYSTRGNTNPYTGREGRIDPYKGLNSSGSRTKSLREFSQELDRSNGKSKSYSEHGSSPYGQIGNRRRSSSPYGQVGR